VSELLPSREPLRFSSDLSSLAVGDSIRHLRNGHDEPEGLLREYLSMIYELRNLPPGSRVPLREPDLAALADALGGTPDAIEQRLMELIGSSREEAARLRAIILPPLSLPAGYPRDPYATPDPYATLDGDAESTGVVDFFSAPRAEDPFSPPPPPGSPPLAPPAGAPGEHAADGVHAGLPTDTFAPPTPAAAASGPVPADPQLVPPLIDPFDPAQPSDRPLPDGLVVDRGMPDAPPLPPDPFGAPDAGPNMDLGMTPDPFGFPNGNGHSDASSIVLDEHDAPVAPEPYMSDTPVLAESVVLDGPPDPLPALDVPVEEPTSAPVAPEAGIEMGAAIGIETGIETGIESAEVDEVAPIAWIAGDQPEGALAPLVAPRFEQVSANWRIGGIFPATAMADDGALALRRADARWALGDLEAPDDFTIDATVDFTAGAGFGILFRAEVDASERIRGYSFDVDPVAGGGGFLLRQWEDNRQHWRPLAQALVTDPTRLFGRHTVQVTLRGDHLSVVVDGETVLVVPGLSHASIALGRGPCRGGGVGVQAWATTEVTVDSFRVAR
jgi:hypothetical protein